MTRKHVGVALFALFIGASFASAQAIRFTESVTASGSLGSTSFTNSLITLTATGNTSNVTHPSLTDPGFSELLVPAASISIAGLGTANLTSSVGVFANPVSSLGPIVGFFDAAPPGYIILST